jgi:hypothetical protein
LKQEDLKFEANLVYMRACFKDLTFKKKKFCQVSRGWGGEGGGGVGGKGGGGERGEK